MAETEGKPAPVHRTPNLAVALLPLVVMALLLGVGYGVYHIKAQILLVCAAAFTGCVGWALGYGWSELLDGIVDSIRKAMPAILIMLCVGLLIGSWISCGTIPMIMYYGLKIISPQYFLVTACVVCTVTALATGTSWGTIGTLGVALMGDLGDFLFIPQIGEPKLVAGSKADPDAGYRARFTHDQEEASAGYYRVKLLNNNVTVELAATERAGMMRFTFPQSDSASIMTDLQHFLSGNRFRLIWSHVRVEDNSTVTGFHLVNGWAKERYLYYAARYSRPFDRHRIMSNGKEVKYDSYATYRFRSRNEAAGTNLQFLAEYKTQADEVITVKVAVSAISAANALRNLDAEIPDWDFDRVVRETRRKWDREPAKIQIEGTQEEKETFYTALYHALGFIGQ